MCFVLVCRAAYPIRARNIPYDRIHEHLASLSESPTRKELEDIWERKGARFAYRSARSGMEPKIDRVLAQLAEVSEVRDISVFSCTGHLMNILKPNGKAMLFSTYQILLDVEARRGIH